MAPPGGDRGHLARGDHAWSRLVLLRPQIALPQIDADTVDGRSSVAPQLASGEFHGVTGLPHLAAPVGIAVGEQKGAIDGAHHPPPPSRVPPKPSKSGP